MPDKKKLEWGRTPYDNLSREDMLKTIWRMYSVIVSLNSIVRMSKYTNPESLYWSKEGVGGSGLEMARQVLEPLENEYEDETICRSFFRYANDLLFEKNGFRMIGADWVVCPECGMMIGSRTKDLVGDKCIEHPMGKPECPGVLRKLIWADLHPDAWKGK